MQGLGYHMQTGIVFNIQKCSIHDGPGIRTLIFLKGCPLKCLWCSNPESQDRRPEVASFYKRCIGCGECAKVCPKNAISDKDTNFKINRRLCDRCGECASVCCADAKQMIGNEMSVEQVMLEIEKDRPFYDKTGGGVTFSGGEPLMQAEFLIAALKTCKEKRIHTALETCGYGDAKALLEASTYLDLIHFDIKHLDPEIHKALTGVSNDVILKNLKKLDAEGVELIIRVPVMPGYNDSDEHIRAIAEFCATLKSVKKVELLPYHSLGAGKYISIDNEYELKDLKGPDKLRSEKLAAIVNEVAAKNDFYCEIVQA